MTALLAGEVPVAIVSIPGIMPHVRAGKVRLLAITAAKRSETAPDLPTIAESGVPGYDVTVWHAMFAPRGTPRPIVSRLNTEIDRILKLPEVRELFLKSHLVAPMGGSSQVLADALKAAAGHFLCAITPFTPNARSFFCAASASARSRNGPTMTRVSSVAGIP